MLFPTSLVGSYPQPDWLIDRERLRHRFPPRVRARELWRVDPALPGRGAGRRDRCSPSGPRSGPASTSSPTARYAGRATPTASPPRWTGVDIDNPGTALDRSGHPNPVPRVTGPIRRQHPVEVRDVAFLRANTDRTIKITVPGPFTMAQQAQNDYYAEHRGRSRSGYAEAVNEEVRDLFAAGRRHRPARRALPAGAPGRGPPVRGGGAQPGAGRRRPAPPPCTCASATRRSSTTARRATRSCPSWRPRTATRSRSRPPSPAWTARCSPSWPARRSSSACSTSATTTVETPDDVVAARVRRALPYVRRRAARARARLRDEVPAPRRRRSASWPR